MGFSGLLDSGTLYEKFDEIVHEGMRLGRNLWLDARSLAHMIENDVAAMSGAIHNQMWERVLAILDQGQVGSCTGNAGTGALGTEPFFSAGGSSALGTSPMPARSRTSPSSCTPTRRSSMAIPANTRPKTRVRPVSRSARC